MALIDKTKEINPCGEVVTTLKYTNTNPWWMALLRSFKTAIWVMASAGIVYIAGHLSYYIGMLQLSKENQELITVMLIPVIAGIAKYISVKREQAEPLTDTTVDKESIVTQTE